MLCVAGKWEPLPAGLGSVELGRVTKPSLVLGYIVHDTVIVAGPDLIEFHGQNQVLLIHAIHVVQYLKYIGEQTEAPRSGTFYQ
jgi:hypothetical protein